VAESTEDEEDGLARIVAERIIRMKEQREALGSLAGLAALLG